MTNTIVNPKDLPPPRGYNHGVMGSGTVLYIAGQIGWDQHARLVSNDLVAQFDQAMANLVRVLHEAGAQAEDVVKMNLYLVDKKAYRQREKEIGAAYRTHMGRHFPAMTLIEVKGLYDDGAQVEIEAVAILP